LVREDFGGGGRLKLPVGLTNVPVKEWGGLELSTGLVKDSVGLVNEKDESARFVREDAGGGGG
jgi:hypothetical protein